MKSKILKAAIAATLSCVAVSSTFLVIVPTRAAVVQDEKHAPVTAQTFLQQSLEGSLFEVKAGQLAKDKATSQGVKDFGDRLVTDHNKAIELIKETASQKNIVLKEEITKKQQKMYDMLAAYSTAEFDQEFVKHMVKGHEANINNTNAAVEKIDDPEIKTLARTLVTYYKAHLEIAKKLDTSTTDAK